MLSAIHESAHAVAAYISKYHFLIGDISLQSDDLGETFVSLSKKKVIAAKLPVDLNVIMKNKDVLTDIAVIFYSGYFAEVFYSKKNNLKVDISFSKNDFNTVMELEKKGGINLDKDEINQITVKLIEENWNAIEALANVLENKKKILAVDVIELLDSNFNI